MSASVYLLAIILGAISGASANWLADTLPYRGRDDAPIHCGLFHYWSLPGFFLRNRRCPHCGLCYSRRSPLLELATIVGFVITLRLQGAMTVDVIIVWIYLTFLMTVLVIDYEHRRVLNIMLGPAVIFALTVSLRGGIDGFISALLGGVAGFGLFLLLAVIGRGKLGAGDVKLAGVIGLMTGYPAVLGALVCGVLLGGVAALILLVSRRATRKSYMAYAPYLVLGALTALWWPGLMRWL